GFNDDRAAGVGRFELDELGPHRLSEAGRVDQTVIIADVEENRGAVVLKLKDRRAFRRRPSLQPPGDRFRPHSDLFERGLGLVEWQAAVSRQGKSRPKEDRRRRPVRLSSDKCQAIKDGIDFPRLLNFKPVHETHSPSSYALAAVRPRWLANGRRATGRSSRSWRK